MKRIAIVLLILVSFIGSASAQKSKRTSAYMYNKNGKLDKAKIAIDLASEHEKTKEDAKTWYYKGLIYLNIATTNKDKYKNLSDNPVSIAYDAFKKAQVLDTDNDFKNDISIRLIKIGEIFFNAGVAKFKTSDFEEAANDFEEAYIVGKSYGNVDTNALQNTALALSKALATSTPEQKPDLIEKVKTVYGQLIDFNVNDPFIYSNYSNLLIEEGKFNDAIAIIQKGRTAFPKDYNLIIAEANIYLKKEDSKKAIELLNQALELDQTNPTIFAAVGNMYSNIVRDTTATNDEKNSALAEAEKAFNKAIELAPDSFDNYFNLGALYYNRGADIIAFANELDFDDPRYPDLEKEAKENLKKAMPYLEKAREINPKDKFVLISLKEVYARTSQYDKLKEVNEKLKELQ
ncbi:MAG: tetratricopeptide repeat protein [Hyphomicrobiales bacterium]